MAALTFCRNDGGRALAGFKGEARDCVTRAIAIASGREYGQVYDNLNSIGQCFGLRSVSRTGVPRAVYETYLFGIGAVWTPTMTIGTGCKVHLDPSELPTGRLICRLSRHLVAVIDGVIHDTHDPSRNGRRCVYGFWTL